MPMELVIKCEVCKKKMESSDGWVAAVKSPRALSFLGHLSVDEMLRNTFGAGPYPRRSYLAFCSGSCSDIYERDFNRVLESEADLAAAC